MKKKWTWNTIADDLKQSFEQDHYKNGDRMPGETKLADHYHVAPTEIRKAYEYLRSQGYLYTMLGYGSYFFGKREKVRLCMNNESFTRQMAALHLPVETRNISCQKLREDSLIHAMLEVDTSEPVYKITRLHLLDETPVAVQISYLAEDLFPCIAEDGSSITSVFEYIRSCGYLHLTSVTPQLSISSLTKKERSLLNIKGYAPSLVLTSRRCSQPSGIIVEVSRTIYRSDQFLFEL